MARPTAPASDHAGPLDALARVAPAFVVLLAGVLGLRRLDNTDTWWHLAAGRWIVEHRSVPANDVLSYTVPDHAWTNVQWLFDVVIYGLYRLGGPSLLVVTAALSYAAATALTLVNVRRSLGPLGAAALVGWATLVSQERFAIRPEMASFLLLQVLLWLYATGRRPGSRRLWFVPVVTAAWANLHSIFIVGAVVVVAQMVGSVVGRLPLLPDGWRREPEPGVDRQVLVTGALALVATAVNPFGVSGAVFPLVLMSRLSGDLPVFQMIGELRRPFSGYFVTLSVTAYQLLVFFAVPVVLVAVGLAAASGRRPRAGAERGRGRAERRRRGERPVPEVPPAPAVPAGPPVHVDLADLAVFVGVTYLSILARRNMALFAMGGAPFLAACLAILRDRLAGAVAPVARTLQAVGAAALCAVLGLGTWFVASNEFYRWNREFHEFGTGVLEPMFPIRLSRFVREQGLPPPLFNDFTTGGYLSWDEPIPGGVYIDGRTEVYDAPFIVAYNAALQNPPQWQEEMDRRGIQTVIFFHWWPNHQKLVAYLLKEPRWAIVYYDETSLVLVRRAGNDALIERATAAFTTMRPDTEAALLAPLTSRQGSIGRARALLVYGDLLQRMGKVDDAIRFYDRFLEVHGAREEEVGIAVRLAEIHANRGETSLARLYLQRAAALAPNDPGVVRLSARLGRQ